jgi:murein DD-endopeptidase MepM/ murein hydrolase activator NlpD
LWRILASSRTGSEALARFKFFHILAAQNAFLIERMTGKHRELAGQHQKLAMRERQFHALEIQAQQTLARIQQQRQARENFLENIRQERSAHEQAVQELTAASENLNRLIKTLEQRARALAKAIQLSGRVFPQRQRTLPWPTRGRVISQFGRVRHPRFNTYMVNKGIDITGPIGQNVVSVARGQVLFAEWFEGFGRMIILDHGGGFNTVYAHLQNISVSAGDVVEENQTIGRLGDSGTWKGPSLYFEVRKRGEALNPLDWLEP